VQPGETLDWKSVPGFPPLLKAFLLEMKQRPAHLWPESMRSCMCTLVRENQELVKVFARLLLGKMMPSQLRPTLASLKQLSAVLDEAAGTGSVTPTLGLHVMANREHPAEMIVHQLRYLVASDHFKVVASALIFLYNHVDKFGEPTRQEALQWLHDEHFAHFALHWSRIVRSVFLHIVVFKVLNHAPSAILRHSSSSGSGFHKAERGMSRSDSYDFLADRSRKLFGNGDQRSLGSLGDLPNRARSMEALPSKSVSLANLSILKDVECSYSALRLSYEKSLEHLDRLAETHPYPADDASLEPLLNEPPTSLATRRGYAKFARKEWLDLQKKWEDMEEMTNRYAEANGPLGEGRSRQLVLSMNVISDDQEDGDSDSGGSIDEW